MSEAHDDAERVATFTPQGPMRPDSPGQVYGITYTEDGQTIGNGFARSDELASWYKDLTAAGWKVEGIYEFGVRYTDDTGTLGIAYDPDKFDPHDRAFADTRTRGMRSAQEDRDIPKDATLMRRLPGGEWEEDPQWAAEIGAWNEYVVQVNALWDAGRDDEARAFRDKADEWLAARQAELLAAGGEGQ